MDLEQEVEPEVETGIPASDESDDSTPSDVEPAREEEPHSRDDSIAERLRMVEAQSRLYQEEAERNRREMESMRASYRPDPREEQARLEAMDPEQRITYIVEKQQRESQNQVALIDARTTAQIDQLKFEAALEKTAAGLGWSSGQKAKYAAETEQVYNAIAQRALSAGRPDWVISRIDLMKHRLGDELMTSGAKAVKVARDKGKTNIVKQTAKMPSVSSNVTGKSAGKTKAQESMERMLQAGVLEM